jgi:hypothetical protein
MSGDDVRVTRIFRQAGVLTAKFLDFFFHRVALGLRPRFCGVRASRIPSARFAASRPAETSADLRGGAGRQGHLASLQ